MSASFTRPLPATILSADQVATAPATNALDDRPGKVWRSTSTSAFVILDLGGGTLSYDTVAIVGTGMRFNDTVRVRTGTTNTGIGAFDSTAQNAFPVNTRPDAFSADAIYQIGTRSERYVRIDFATNANLEAQRIVIGPSLTVLGIDYDAEQTVMDSSSIDTTLGADTITTGITKVKWKFSISTLSGSDWRNKWVGFLATVGKRVPILFIPFVETPATWQAEVVFGRIRNDASGKIPGGDLRTLELTIEGLAL